MMKAIKRRNVTVICLGLLCIHLPTASGNPIELALKHFPRYAPACGVFRPTVRHYSSKAALPTPQDLQKLHPPLKTLQRHDPHTAETVFGLFRKGLKVHNYGEKGGMAYLRDNRGFLEELDSLETRWYEIVSDPSRQVNREAYTAFSQLTGPTQSVIQALRTSLSTRILGE